MRTRKIFFHEDGIYEGTSRLPEPSENNPAENISLNDSYDCYPEKEPNVKDENSKIDGSIDVPLGDEYNLQSQINKYSNTNYHNNQAMAALLKKSKI